MLKAENFPREIDEWKKKNAKNKLNKCDDYEKFEDIVAEKKRLRMENG